MVDAIGTSQLLANNAPVLPAPPVGNTAPAVPANPAPVQPNVTDQVELSSQAVQAQAIQPKVEYANPEVLGTSSFSLYKAGGQFVERIVDQKTGRVTYIPKEVPVLGDSSGEPALDITA